ncbi:type II secretion system F family protein [uncultured Pseudokineococcus sp.]|uniref:type II secretion system F family protein n=1 Tax=uncultured Pseudokineococcus sp. TaxID=1642928 RepID=UPI002614EDAA|nr:type II secretion system F family protein [uncultured Pseudokineococcus sp.]
MSPALLVAGLVLAAVLVGGPGASARRLRVVLLPGPLHGANRGRARGGGRDGRWAPDGGGDGAGRDGEGPDGPRGRLASRWLPRTRSRPGPADAAPDPALLLDLVAAALEAGSPPLAALEAAAAALGRARPSPHDEDLRQRCAALRLGAGWSSAWEGAGPELAPVRDALGLAVGAGAPGAALLRDAASEERRRRAREAQRRASALGVRLVLPLGLCALPAFAALAVVPVVLSLAAQVLERS